MKFIKESFLNLQSVEKIKRSPISGHSGLYCEQNKSGYTFQLKYKSPVTGKQRFLKLTRFKYGDNINKKMLDIILKQMIIAQGNIAQKYPLEDKKAKREAKMKPKKVIKTVNDVFDIYTDLHNFKQKSDNTKASYLSAYRLHIAKYWGKRDVTSI